MALDAHEEVVEVVGDPAGERPDGLHFLRLEELGLELPGLGDIAGDAADADDFPRVVEHGDLHDVQRHGHAVDRLAVLDLHHLAVEDAVIHLAGPLLGFLPENLSVGKPHDLRGGLAEQGLHAGVHQHILERAVLDEDAVRGRLEDGAEVFLALAQGLLGELALGDVVDHGDDADDLPAGVAVGGVGARNPARLSALGDIVGEIRRRDRGPIECPVQQDVHALLPEVGEDLEGVRAQDFLGRQSRQFLHEAVPDDVAALAVVDDDPLVGAGDDLLVEALRFPQRLLAALSLRDVLVDGDDPPFPEVVADAGGMEPHHDLAAVHAAAGDLGAAGALPAQRRVNELPDVVVFLVAAVEDARRLADEFLGAPAENGVDGVVGEV